jgi:hypothetical protein
LSVLDSAVRVQGWEADLRSKEVSICRTVRASDTVLHGVGTALGPLWDPARSIRSPVNAKPLHTEASNLRLHAYDVSLLLDSASADWLMIVRAEVN